MELFVCRAIKALSPITPPISPDPDPVRAELMGKAWSFVPAGLRQLTVAKVLQEALF